MLPSSVFRLFVGIAATATAGVALASAEGESAPVSLNPLSWEWIEQDLAIWTAVVFIGLLVILRLFAWKPIMEGIDRREKGVADQIAQAEAANQRAAELLAEHQRRLDAAGDEVRGIVEQGRRDAEQLGRELLEKAKQEAKAEQDRALKQIDAAADAALKGLADQSATLAVELAGRIVHAKLNPRDHAALVDQAIGGFMQNKNHVSQN